MVTIGLMAFGTVGIGVLPDRRAIGSLAADSLGTVPLLQGFSAGGEWQLHRLHRRRAPAGHRGFFGSLQQASVLWRIAARIGRKQR